MGRTSLGATVWSERTTHGGPTRAWWWLVVSVGCSLALLVGAMIPGAAHAQDASTNPGAVASPTIDDVVDFAEIQASDVAIDLDPSGTAATITVGTTIDAACAVVYGEDETLGRLALDADMGTAAHRDHRVVLGRLEPSTTYVFRFQGSGIDGRLYRSQLYAFTTPEPSASAPIDLAIGATIVEVSSEFSEAFAATNAVDGDPTTEWSTKGDGGDAFITLDLGRPTDIAAVAYQTRQMGDGTAITETFTVTADGARYGPFPASELVPLELSAQVLRFDVESSTGGNTGATAIEVYGEPPAR